MSLSVHTRAFEWIFRTQALHAARAQESRPDDSRARSVQQAKLLLEAARRVLEPTEPLPPGDRAAAAFPLYRAAIESLLSAYAAGASMEDLAALWDEAPPALLARAEPDPVGRAQVKAALLSPASFDSADEQAVLRVRRFAESLAAEAAARPKQVDLILAQRWFRLLLLGLVLALGVVGIRALLTRPDLAKGKRFWTSSRWPGCPGALPCADLMFHTEEEQNPWVEIDLGAPQLIRRIEVSNRADCCADRDVPLIAEVSRNGTQWTEVGRRTTDFLSWTAKFPPTTARYVRLRVPRRTTFHLRSVAVR